MWVHNKHFGWEKNCVVRLKKVEQRKKFEIQTTRMTVRDHIVYHHECSSEGNDVKATVAFLCWLICKGAQIKASWCLTGRCTLKNVIEKGSCSISFWHIAGSSPAAPAHFGVSSWCEVHHDVNQPRFPPQRSAKFRRFGGKVFEKNHCHGFSLSRVGKWPSGGPEKCFQTAHWGQTRLTRPETGVTGTCRQSNYTPQPSESKQWTTGVQGIQREQPRVEWNSLDAKKPKKPTRDTCPWVFQVHWSWKQKNLFENSTVIVCANNFS